MAHKVLFLFFLGMAGQALGSTCEEIGKLNLDNVAITASEEVPAGDYQIPDSPLAVKLPSHCSVKVILTPSSDSHIEMELWMPSTNWNGKFLALGNGGWAGSISYAAMASGLEEGYAVASNDTGHKEYSAAFAVGHPEKLVDFGYRSMHEMAIHSKTIIEHFYERAPALSYFEGCSTGGRQGLMEAQRFPEDFDAIIAGAPVNNMFNVSAAQMHSMVSILSDQSLYLPPEKVQLLHKAVLYACESVDGVNDGFLNNPMACHFDPQTLQCSATATIACLTPGQVASVQQVYAPVKMSNGQEVYPGHAPGFELGWRMLEQGAVPPTLQSDTFKYIAHQDPDWDWQTFDLDTDTTLALARADDVSAIDPDLSEFKARGGKLLIYHGWNDPGPSPYNSINYYSAVLNTLGGDQSDWLRMFMMPGMGHCRGGIGPDHANFLHAVDNWREQGIAPNSIEASRIQDGNVDMTRPLCPYPQVAAWTGEGSSDIGENFVCTVQ